MPYLIDTCCEVLRWAVRRENDRRLGSECDRRTPDRSRPLFCISRGRRLHSCRRDTRASWRDDCVRIVDEESTGNGCIRADRARQKLHVEIDAAHALRSDAMHS